MPGAARKHTLMFTVDESHAVMPHAFAEELFRAFAIQALSAGVAGTLSLHGERIFLAVALRARGYGLRRWHDQGHLPMENGR